MGRKLSTVAVAAALSLSLGGMTATAPAVAADQAAAPARDCFRLSQVQSMRPDGDKAIYVTLNSKRVYRIDLAHQCSALRSQDGLVIKRAGGSDLVCSAVDLDIAARELGGGAAVPCFLDRITSLNPQEIAALPQRLR